jgi:hypothetical protein
MFPRIIVYLAGSPRKVAPQEDQVYYIGMGDEGRERAVLVARQLGW